MEMSSQSVTYQVQNVSLESLIERLGPVMQENKIGAQQIVFVRANLKAPGVNTLIIPGVSGRAARLYSFWRERCARFLKGHEKSPLSGKIVIVVAQDNLLAVAQHKASAVAGVIKQSDALWSEADVVRDLDAP
jgi:hypothetical protein